MRTGKAHFREHKAECCSAAAATNEAGQSKHRKNTRWGHDRPFEPDLNTVRNLLTSAPTIPYPNGPKTGGVHEHGIVQVTEVTRIGRNAPKVPVTLEDWAGRNEVVATPWTILSERRDDLEEHMIGSFIRLITILTLRVKVGEIDRNVVHLAGEIEGELFVRAPRDRQGPKVEHHTCVRVSGENEHDESHDGSHDTTVISHLLPFLCEVSCFEQHARSEQCSIQDDAKDLSPL